MYERLIYTNGFFFMIFVVFFVRIISYCHFIYIFSLFLLVWLGCHRFIPFYFNAFFNIAFFLLLLLLLSSLVAVCLHPFRCTRFFLLRDFLIRFYIFFFIFIYLFSLFLRFVGVICSVVSTIICEVRFV